MIKDIENQTNTEQQSNLIPVAFKICWMLAIIQLLLTLTIFSWPEAVGFTVPFDMVSMPLLTIFLVIGAFGYRKYNTTALKIFLTGSTFFGICIQLYRPILFTVYTNYKVFIPQYFIAMMTGVLYYALYVHIMIPCFKKIVQKVSIQ